MKPHPKPARGKAVVLYLETDGDTGKPLKPLRANQEPVYCCPGQKPDIPVAVCDLSPAENEARVELAAKAIYETRFHPLKWKNADHSTEHHRFIARAALLAIGVIAAPEKGEKK